MLSYREPAPWLPVVGSSAGNVGKNGDIPKMAEKKQHKHSSNTDNSTKNNKDPNHDNQGTVHHSDDGRLKENREKGVHRGDKE
jgi:hypothetical protein